MFNYFLEFAIIMNLPQLFYIQLVFIIICSSCIESFAEYNNSSMPIIIEIRNDKEVFSILAVLLTVGMGGLITYTVGSKIKEKFRLREVYFVPYKKWCTGLYGEIQEFKTLIKFKESLSDDYIVSHFWEIHKAISSGHTWLGKIHRDTHKIVVGKGSESIKNDITLYNVFENFINYIDFHGMNLKINIRI